MLDDLELVRALSAYELKRFGREEMRDSYTDLTPFRQERSALTDLRAVVGNTTVIHLDAPVRVLARKVVNADLANGHYQGAVLGNLVAGNPATKLDTLVDKSERRERAGTQRFGIVKLFERRL